jgi:transcriptional regulator with XRE-family HTH domain
LPSLPESTIEAGALVGARVSRARQEAGLSEKQLAIRLGLPLWQIERIQNGAEDPRVYLADIADTTGKPTDWFLVDEADAPPDSRSRTERLRTAAKDLTTRLARRARMRDGGEQPAGEGTAELQAAGARIERARQEAELTRKQLGELLGVPIWHVERMELGEEDPTAHLQSIAARTGRPPQWFLEPLNGATLETKSADTAAAPEDPTSTRERLARPFRRNAVMACIVLLVTIRFFTEVVPLLPRPAKLVDIPVLLVLLVLAAAVPRTQSQRQNTIRYVAPAAVFLLIALVSIMANLDRVATGPTLLFLYGFLAPLAVYVAVYYLWPPGNALSMSRLLVSLAAVQFAVVGLIDLPLFLASHNPDKITGTFGENAYQLVIFLMVVAALVAGIYTFESKRLAARLAPFFFVATLLTILLAQYRAILLTLLTTALLIAVLLGFLKLRGAIASVIIAVTIALGLSYVSSLYPELKYASTVSTLTSEPGLYLSKRFGIVGDVGKLYTDNPRFIVTGTGPGTYSSRAWYTFQPVSRSKKGIGFQAAGKQGYQTDVSRKYVEPRLGRTTAESVGGSYAVTSPFSSYTSLLAEVGIAGFVAMVLIYGGAFLAATRMTIQSLRMPRAQDPLPGLLLACTAGFFILLQLAVLENWWEVTRLTFILWALLAVGTKEFSARYGAGTREEPGTPTGHKPNVPGIRALT